MSRGEPPDKKTASPNDVWEQLDKHARERVIELFAHLAYQLAVARHDSSAEEE